MKLEIVDTMGETRVYPENRKAFIELQLDIELALILDEAERLEDDLFAYKVGSK